MRGGGDGLPLLRGITAQTLAGVAAEEQVIVFAERVWCLRQLARTLVERHGVEAHVADGQVKPPEFEALKHAFTGGEFPVLCLSRIGARGPQPAERSVPHAPRPAVAARRASSSASAAPRARAPRAAGCRPTSPTSAAPGSSTSSRSSPPAAPSTTPCSTRFEGVAANQSTVATQLGQITGQVADAKQDAGFAATAARLRVAASVFGT